MLLLLFSLHPRPPIKLTHTLLDRQLDKILIEPLIPIRREREHNADLCPLADERLDHRVVEVAPLQRVQSCLD